MLNVKQHLEGRNLNTTLYSSMVVADEVAVFPLWNLSGQMVGYQQYRPLGDKSRRRNPMFGKYFTKVSKKGNQTQMTAWGLELLNPVRRRLYLLEGVFSACRFHNYGLNALALLSNNPKHLKGWLHSLGYELFCVCDGDSAGTKLAKVASRCYMMPDGDYVDELTDKQFTQLLCALESS